MQHYSGTPDIASLAVEPPGHHLWRHVMRTSHASVCFYGFPGAGQLDGRTEAAKFHGRRVVDGGEKGAGGTHVPVQDVVLVAITQRLQDLAHIVTGRK